MAHPHPHPHPHLHGDGDGAAASHLWASLLSTALISVVPALLLVFVPITWLKGGGAGSYVNFQRALLAFAAGGLLGDVFLHSIPHLFADHDHSYGHGAAEVHTHIHAEGEEHCSHTLPDHAYEHLHEEDVHMHAREESLYTESHPLPEVDSHISAHSHSASTQIGLAILAGFLIFFLVEKLLAFYMRGTKLHKSHSHESTADDDSRGLRKSADASMHGHQHAHELGTGGMLNMAADFMHNFTDGIAIGASFANSNNLGVATTLSVLFHEIPHEIGDFAILVQNGFSKWKAIGAQLLTAIGALLGTLLGLLAERNQGLEKMLLSITSGGFVYIAASSVIPELLSPPAHGTNVLLQTVLEGFCFVAGVSMMVWVAEME